MKTAVDFRPAAKNLSAAISISGNIQQMTRSIDMNDTKIIHINTCSPQQESDSITVRRCLLASGDDSPHVEQEMI
jgi:hypothetical protein